MNIELAVPPELLEKIIEGLFEKIRPLLTPLDKHGAGSEEDIIFDVKELSEYLEVSKKWIYEQTHLKAIPHYKLGNKQVRFRKKDIDAWLCSLKVPSASIPFIKPKKPLLLNKLKMGV
jgi:excisionase family DNA binding protein